LGEYLIVAPSPSTGLAGFDRAGPARQSVARFFRSATDRLDMQQSPREDASLPLLAKLGSR